MSQLERAAKLHEQGLLSDQEFTDLKQRLLNGTLTPPQPPAPEQPAPPDRTTSADSNRGGSDRRIPALLLAGLTAFQAAGLRRPVRNGPDTPQGPSGDGGGGGTTYNLNDGTPVQFDSNGNFVTPDWADGGMDTATNVHMFPSPVTTTNDPQLGGKGLPPTINGGIDLPSSPNDPMYLSRTDGPPGDNHQWFVAYTFIDPRLNDPAATEKPGWVPYALIVQDQNGYHQVTDPPAKGSGAAAAMAAGLAMWGFQHEPPGAGTAQGGRGGGGGGRGGKTPPKPGTGPPAAKSRAEAEKYLNEGAVLEKDKDSIISRKEGGAEKATRDFEGLTKGREVREQPNGSKVAQLEDGSYITLRGSSDGRTTISLQEKGTKPSKFRYQ
ncbi:SHOCT domain-containing protein [Nocardia sp. NPDC051756]|uniref:SHOCT domain-containing protein n=1 Tax=Nocardia sp. NPDC051756 TaxID=3154751 RepID=UPI0034279793